MTWHRANNDLLCPQFMALIQSAPRSLAAAALGLLSAVRSWCSTHRTCDLPAHVLAGIGCLLRLTGHQVETLTEALEASGYLGRSAEGFVLTDGAVVAPVEDKAAIGPVAHTETTRSKNAERQAKFKARRRLGNASDGEGNASGNAVGNGAGNALGVTGNAVGNAGNVTSDSPPPHTPPPRTYTSTSTNPEKNTPLPPDGGSVAPVGGASANETGAIAGTDAPQAQPEAPSPALAETSPEAQTAPQPVPEPSQPTLAGLDAPAASPPSTARRSAPSTSARANTEADVERVLTHWSATLYAQAPRKPMFSPERRKRIAKRLAEGFSAADLCKAVDGATLDDWLMGRKEGSPGYRDVKQVLRDAAQVERLIELAEQAKQRESTKRTWQDLRAERLAAEAEAKAEPPVSPEVWEQRRALLAKIQNTPSEPVLFGEALVAQQKADLAAWAAARRERLAQAPQAQAVTP